MSFLSALLIGCAALMAIEVLILISRVGKPREPITGGLAVAGVLEWGFIICVVVVAALELS